MDINIIFYLNILTNFMYFKSIFSSKTIIEKVSNECTFYTIQLITLSKSFDTRLIIYNFIAQKTKNVS